MYRDNRPIIGISLGTRALGIALIKDGTLLYWQVKRFKGKWSAKSVESVIAFIDQFVKRHDVWAMAVKVPPRGHLSKGLSELIYSISMYAADRNLELKPYRIQELKQFLSTTSLNRTKMMQLVCEQFPVLKKTYQRELQNKQAYHVKIFEAILAALCLQAKRKRMYDHK